MDFSDLTISFDITEILLGERNLKFSTNELYKKPDYHFQPKSFRQ